MTTCANCQKRYEGLGASMWFGGKHIKTCGNVCLDKLLAALVLQGSHYGEVDPMVTSDYTGAANLSLRLVWFWAGLQPHLCNTSSKTNERPA
jgi:hypothetical protein